MTRLDKAIRRLECQRALLDAAAAAVAERHRPGDGWVVELGLGNGRTFHHLRHRLPGFRIVAFERLLVAHPSSVPPPHDLVLGEIGATVPAFVAREGARTLLLHADLGNGVEADDRVLEAWLPDAAVALAAPGAIILSSTRLAHARLLAEALPPDEGYEYFRYRVAGGPA